MQFAVGVVIEEDAEKEEDAPSDEPDAVSAAPPTKRHKKAMSWDSGASAFPSRRLSLKATKSKSKAKGVVSEAGASASASGANVAAAAATDTDLDVADPLSEELAIEGWEGPMHSPSKQQRFQNVIKRKVPFVWSLFGANHRIGSLAMCVACVI